MKAIGFDSVVRQVEIQSRSLRASNFRSSVYLGLMLCAVAGSLSQVSGQSLFPLNSDVAIGGTAQLSAPIQDSTVDPNNVQLGPAGVLITLQEHPLTWAGFDLSFRYSREAGSVGNEMQRPPSQSYDATAAYLMHARFERLQPFVGLGGGGIYFYSTSASGAELRVAGLLETGIDISVLNPHLGLRVEGRSLCYRRSILGGESAEAPAWIIKVEPSASLFWRF